MLHALVSDDSSLVVACSGGPDSTAALLAVVRAHRGPVTAATFDHEMREGSEADVAMVHRVACDLGVQVIEGRAASTLRGEAAARTARYRWLARACWNVGANVCITGHTRDDQAETVLLRLARGSGARGVAGMSSDAPWPVAAPSGPALRLLRPLLEVARVEVEIYLTALGVEAVRDPSNDSLAYARNQVRHQVLPALVEVNAQARAHLASFADRQREDDSALTVWARAWLDKHATVSQDALALPRKRLVALPLAVERRVLAEAGERLGVRLGEAHLRGLGGLVRGPGGADLAVPGGTAEVRGTVLGLRRMPHRSAH